MQWSILYIDVVYSVVFLILQNFTIQRKYLRAINFADFAASLQSAKIISVKMNECL